MNKILFFNLFKLILKQQKNARSPKMKEKVQDTYKKVTQIQHVLLRPDTYVGSISAIEDNMWILQNDEIVYERIKYVPGLYKIFDEVLVNASDNYQRDHKMSKIEVTIEKNGTITVLNDGKGIPVQIHKEHKIYVTEMIFGHLLTSSNYEDNKKKVTGGRNGYGAKLANIFSKQFTVESADSHSRKLLKIEWKNNMSQMTQPLITPYEGKDYTKITFLPDYERFGLKNLTREMTYLLKKRVYDMAGILKVKVYLNGSLVPIKTFQDYILLYVKDKQSLIFDDAIHSKRWSVMITKSEGQFQQISFVNGISTTKGGSHVNYITDQIVQLLMPILKKKAKDITIKPFQIKNQIKVFVNCLIQNPSFDSQTKETLTTTVSNFGSTFQVTDKMIKQIQKAGICDMILKTVRAKQNSKIDKHLKKIKNNKIIIPKLQQANLAGKSDKCTLILTEGDSAKTLAMSGIQKLKRDYYGIYPLKGKVINVRDCSVKQVMDNQQLANIVKILGLQFGKQYQTTKQLRYGCVMIMADQDIDGSHIKGLVINFFQTFWPSLCKINGFLKQFVTPIIRCKNNIQTVDFFSQTDYELWKINATTDWKIKYYKGLGTSTHSEAKQYFSNLQKHQIEFHYSDENDKQAINLAFNKKFADERKRWLEQYNYRINVNYSVKTLKVQDFVNKQLIHFSISDNIRSIPSLIDGLKPSQRKILYACFKRNLRNQIKVAQLTGYVAQHSAYHHGQMSLSQTIIGMAQNYIGSNNLNLLQPIGQFGTRYMNGKDHASPRYIFTNLNPLTRYLFNQADDHVVEYIEQENIIIEPIYYVPILPLVLINGCQGIGTGWSTTVYPHKVTDVIELIRKRIRNQTHTITIGWQGFKGDVIMDKPNSYIIKGIFQIQSDTVSITQIPTSKSIRDYKSFLQQRLDSIDNKDPDIQDLRQYHRDGNIHFEITFIEGKQPKDNIMQNYLKLSTNLQENNMVLFNRQQKIQKFATVNDIVEEFYIQRIKAYTKRKQYLISRFKREYEILTCKINFIKQVINGQQFKMMDRKQAWIDKLIKRNFKSFSQLTKTKSTKTIDYTGQNNSESTTTTDKDYNYLLSMPIWNFCNEKIVQLQNGRRQIEDIISYYEKVSQIQLWQKDINQFEKVWKIHHRNRFQQDQQQSELVMRRRNNHNIVMANNKSTTTTNKRGRMMVQSEEQEQIELRDKPNKRILTTSKQSSRTNTRRLTATGKRNLIQQQIDQKQLLATTKIMISQEERIIQPIQESNINSILNKYLLNGSTDGLSFEQRLKVKLSQIQNNLYDNQKKIQKQQEKKQHNIKEQTQNKNDSNSNIKVEVQQQGKQKYEEFQYRQNDKNEQQQKNKDLNEYDWMFHEY